MNKRNWQFKRERYSKLAVLAALCLFPVASWSQQAVTEDDPDVFIGFPGMEFLAPVQNRGLAGSLISDPDRSAGLAFDMAGSETRKLELQLAQPLTLSAGTLPMAFENGRSVLASAGLDWTVSEELRLGAGMNTQTSRFQALGSIHCEDGVLDSGSYRASNCYFTNGVAGTTATTLNLGAEYRVTENASTGINLFRQHASAGSNAIGAVPGSGVSIAGNLLAPSYTDPLRMSGNGILPGQLESEVSGIDLEFRLGVSTDNAGEMHLGLQFTRVLDAEFDTTLPLQGISQWTLAEPVDSAKISFDWQRNAFSGGIQGFYREPINFMNRNDTDGMTMFDVYFSWRTPWNASLSVGASNLLNNGQEDSKAPENNIVDPFESIYGRIPYVRYQQDL